MYKNIEIIAEVKTHSPFGYTSEKSWDELFAVANEIRDILSIHTDPRWGGSFELLEKARSRTNKPILAKGIHDRARRLQIHLSPQLHAGATFFVILSICQIGLKQNM